MEINRRLGTGTVWAYRVVGVLAIGDGIAVSGGDVALDDTGEQVGLAVEATVGAVRAICGVVQFMGGEVDKGHTDGCGGLASLVVFARGEAGRNPQDGQDPAGAETAYSDREQD